MEFKDYLEKAKKQSTKKVPYNFKISRELRDEFKKLCKENNVTMTDMIISFIDTAIEHDKKDK